MTNLEERVKIVKDVTCAIENNARVKKACEVIYLSHKTYLRWKQNNQGDLRPIATKTNPNALTHQEKELIVSTCTSAEFKDMTSNEIVPILAERGTYIASESTFYKVLKENKLLKHRENTLVPQKRIHPPELIATGPNQVYSWDITYLRTNIKGLFFYLYFFMDVWSRKIVGWTIEDHESGEVASNQIKKICLENNISNVKLHSDNGSPMKCGTMLATLQRLGVVPSFSRPGVSNDNAFSEALFKTLKYRPSYPKSFETIDLAKEWVSNFCTWYNTKHHHSGIKYVTPEQRHTGQDIEILKTREDTYELAKLKTPQRWAKNTRDWSHQETVRLNKAPEKINAEKTA